MSDKPETVDDILAEMRREERPYGISNNRLRSYADRIEAAAKRERDEDRQLAAIAESDEAFARCARCDRPERAPNNAAAMREALHECLAAATHLRALFCNTDPMQGPDRAIRVNDLEPIADKIERATAALAAPARNCDRPECRTRDEAWKVFERESAGMWAADWDAAFMAWLFDTKEGGDHA